MSSNSDKMDNLDSSFTGNNETYKRGEHPNSKSNLKPFEKGESGDPDGLGIKITQLRDALNIIGDEEVWTNPDWLTKEEKRLLGTRRHMVRKQIWDKAMEGDIKFTELLGKLGCLGK